MNRAWQKVWRSLTLLALGGTSFGCNYATFKDYTTLFQASGGAVIKAVSDNVFGNIGTDYDTVVRAPTTAFAQAAWNNWVDAHVPDDLPRNAVVLR